MFIFIIIFKKIFVRQKLIFCNADANASADADAPRFPNGRYFIKMKKAAAGGVL